MMSKLKRLLINELKGKIPENLLSLIPSRYPIIGDCVLIRLNEKLIPYGRLIGNLILKFLRVQSVWAIKTTSRIIREPSVIHLAGKKDPIVVHKELNTLFKIDISRLTFSPGNREERKKLVSIIKPGDIVVDMFACAGNLSLPTAVNCSPRIIYAIEINPYAFRFLLENIKMNRVVDRVIPLLMNNVYFNEKNIADHVLLGYLPEPSIQQLGVAVEVAKDRGMIHYHTLARRGSEHEKVGKLLNVLSSFDNITVGSYKWERVKSFSPAYNHIVIRVEIMKD